MATSAKRADRKERPIVSRWGHPIADDYGYVDIPGWILRNYHKCGVSPLEMMFVTHVMAFKYDRKADCDENPAKPSLATIAQYMGRDTSNVRRLKQGLIKKGLLTVTSSKGKADEYDFAGLTNRCLQLEMEARQTPGKNTSGKNTRGSSTPGKNTTPVPLVKIPAEDSEVLEDSESNTFTISNEIVARASENPQRINPEAKRESTEPPTVQEQLLTTSKELPPAPAGLEWYALAGENYLYHLAKPTKSGKQIKPLCGTPGYYAVPADVQTVGNRQPCADCQRKAAARPDDKPKDWSVLTKAMYEAIPDAIRPPRCHYAANNDAAKALWNVGYTPDRIAAYVKDVYANDTWFMRGGAGNTPIVINMSMVEKRIKAWEAKSTNGRAKDDYISDPIFHRN